MKGAKRTPVLHQVFLSAGVGEKSCISNTSKCIAELRHKSELYRSSNLVEALDDIFKSDTVVPEDLRQSLLKAVLPLENVPEKHKDWHPGSNQQVLDLVHPSLFPLVYGQSRILPYSIASIQDCIARCGDGVVIPASSIYETYDEKRHLDFDGAEPWSQRFQWLLSDFELPEDIDQVK